MQLHQIKTSRRINRIENPYPKRSPFRQSTSSSPRIPAQSATKDQAKEIGWQMKNASTSAETHHKDAPSTSQDEPKHPSIKNTGLITWLKGRGVSELAEKIEQAGGDFKEAKRKVAEEIKKVGILQRNSSELTRLRKYEKMWERYQKIIAQKPNIGVLNSVEKSKLKAWLEQRGCRSRLLAKIKKAEGNFDEVEFWIKEQRALVSRERKPNYDRRLEELQAYRTDWEEYQKQTQKSDGDVATSTATSSIGSPEKAQFRQSEPVEDAESSGSHQNALNSQSELNPELSNKVISDPQSENPLATIMHDEAFLATIMNDEAFLATIMDDGNDYTDTLYNMVLLCEEKDAEPKAAGTPSELPEESSTSAKPLRSEAEGEYVMDVLMEDLRMPEGQYEPDLLDIDQRISITELSSSEIEAHLNSGPSA
ncbi:MAG: hypothetical protein C5B47_02340 [Verrucomicrobia bacterium]|nr:MAG: hypothetical protein C5B47_02340 [Verrucomicrobiota bacterium]